MTAKEYLGQAYIIDRKINVAIAKANKMRESLYGRGQKIDEIGGGKSSGNGDIIGETIAKVISYERQADELIDKLVKARFEIEKVIQSVPDEDQREVLERRYLLYQPWDSYYDKHTGIYVKGIYDTMGYSRRQIFRIHGEALQSMALNGIEWHSYV